MTLISVNDNIIHVIMFSSLFAHWTISVACLFITLCSHQPCAAGRGGEGGERGEGGREEWTTCMLLESYNKGTCRANYIVPINEITFLFSRCLHIEYSLGNWFFNGSKDYIEMMIIVRRKSTSTLCISVVSDVPAVEIFSSYNIYYRELNHLLGTQSQWLYTYLWLCKCYIHTWCIRFYVHYNFL